MKKSFVLIIMIACIVITLVPMTGAVAAEGLTVRDNGTVIDFPMGVMFSVDAESSSDIIDIRLHYMIDRERFARVVNEIKLPFTSDDTVTAEWYWDMRMTGGLPMGTNVDYWWTVTDESGTIAESLPVTLILEDTRYDWRSIEDGMVTLNWYHGDEAFAGELMDATQGSLDRLADTAGAELEKPVDLYIYKNSSDLRGALLYAQEWTGGVAFTQFGVVAIGIGTSQSEMAWGTRTIAHELTHLVTAQVVANPFGGMPTWLNEGLSMYAEGDLEASFENVFESALDTDTLISIRSLSSPFSTDNMKAYLSYAESYHIVTYLIGTYGRDDMLRLLDTIADGTGYDEALLEVYGFNMDGLNAEWTAYEEGAAVL